MVLGGVSQVTGRVTGFTCAHCGAAIVFDPATQGLVCGHCGAKQAVKVDRASATEHDFIEGLAKMRRSPIAQVVPDASTTVRCATCGATFMLAGAAGHCPFCASPQVVAVRDATDPLVPENVLPFRVDKKTADEKFREWIRGRWFAPSALKRLARTEGLRGVYLPFWTYDSDTTTDYTGERGRDYTVTESYTDGQGKRQTRSVTRTDWTSVSGSVSVAFDDVLVYASTSLPAELVDVLEPWDLADLRPFDPQLLAGFIAERCDVGLEDGFARAEAKMQRGIQSAIRRDIGGDKQRISSSETRHRNRRFKQTYLPVWVAAFRHGGKSFRVIQNARTAEVQGERPWSWVKITLALLTLAGAIGGAVWYFSQPS